MKTDLGYPSEEKRMKRTHRNLYVILTDHSDPETGRWDMLVVAETEDEAVDYGMKEIWKHNRSVSQLPGTLGKGHLVTEAFICLVAKRVIWQKSGVYGTVCLDEWVIGLADRNMLKRMGKELSVV